MLGSPYDCRELRVWCLCPEVTVLGGKVRAPVCVSMWEAVRVWMCTGHLKASPGSWGVGEGLYLLPSSAPQVEGYPRASLWVCSAVTKT